MHTVRANLDSADALATLQSYMLRYNLSLSMLGQTSCTAVRGTVECSMRSHVRDSPTYITTAIVIAGISVFMPSLQFEPFAFIYFTTLYVLLEAVTYPCALNEKKRVSHTNAFLVLEPFSDGLLLVGKENEPLENYSFLGYARHPRKCSKLSLGDSTYEKLFSDSYYCDVSGDSQTELGDSQTAEVQCFLSLERILSYCTYLHQDYIKFVQDRAFRS